MFMKKRNRGGQPLPHKIKRRNGVTVRMRDATMQRLQRAASADRRSISQQAELFIEEALARRAGGGP